MPLSRSDVASLERRLRRVEGLLTALARRLELTPEEIEEATRANVSAEVAQLVSAGRKIMAIKILREQEGLGLAEAKRIIDEL